MSIKIEPRPRDRARFFPPLARPAGLCLLLVAEGVAFTLRFDGSKVLDTAGAWISSVFRPRDLVHLLVVTVVATAVLGGHRLAIRLCRSFEDADAADRSWTPWLVAHGLALLGFATLSVPVCDGGPAAGWTVAAWAGFGLVSGVTWLATLLPATAWAVIARRHGSALGRGAAVGFLAVIAGHLTSPSWSFLAWSTFQVVRKLLGLVSADVICDPASATLGASGFAVTIAPECSGFEGIGLIWAFLAAYLWWFRSSLRWPRAWALIPLGTTLIWLTNAVRITALILIGAWGSPDVALGGFHSQAGWLAFLGVGLGLVAVSRRWPWFAAEGRGDEQASWSNPTAAYLVPFLAIVAGSMATGAFASGFDAWYGLRAVLGGWALWHFRRDFGGLGCPWPLGAVGIGVAAFVLWVALEPAPVDSARALESGLASLPRGGAWAWVACRVIGSVLVVPLAEELAFRGFLIRRLVAADFESVPPGRWGWLPLLISSAAFGLLHGRWLAGTLVGLMFAFALRRRGKLGDAVAAHATTNFLIAVAVLTWGDWALWS